MIDDFEDEFTAALETAGQALEENGYEVADYHVFTQNYDSKMGHANHAETPEKALADTLDEISGEQIPILIEGSDLAKMAKGQGDLSQALYQTINGGISTEEPKVSQEDWTDEAQAFGTIIHYTPEFPNDYFTVGTSETIHPYTTGDAEERVNDIRQILEDAGFDTEEGYIG